jgi:hypothetical protein
MAAREQLAKEQGEADAAKLKAEEEAAEAMVAREHADQEQAEADAAVDIAVRERAEADAAALVAVTKGGPGQLVLDDETLFRIFNTLDTVPPTFFLLLPVLHGTCVCFPCRPHRYRLSNTRYVLTR